MDRLGIASPRVSLWPADLASVHRDVRSAGVVAVVLILVALGGCSFSLSTARVTDVVMVKDVKGTGFEPVDVTETYSADQQVFHAVVSVANAPGDTAIKAVWTVVDVGAAEAAGTKIDEAEVKVEGSRNVDFSLTHSAGTPWPAGTYKVDVYLNRKLAKTVSFSVAPAQAGESFTAATATAPAAPEETAATDTKAGGCRPLPTPVTKPSPFVTSVALARGTQGDAKEPVDPTTVFQADSVFHAVVSLDNAPDNTVVGAAWYVTDVGDAAPCDTSIDSGELTAGGTRNLDFFLAPASKWPVGTYRVEILVNGELDRVLSFSVQ